MDLQRALKQFAESLSSDTEGKRLMHKGENLEAISWFEKDIEQSPNDVYLWIKHD